LLLQEPSGIFG